MKKSKSVKLLVVASMVAGVIACESKKDNEWGEGNKKSSSQLHLRSDSTSRYTRSYFPYRYYMFHSYGFYSPTSGYSKAGYSSGAISPNSNPRSARGGFGGRGFRVSS